MPTDPEAAVAVFVGLEASDEELSLASVAFPSPPMLLESPYGPSIPKGRSQPRRVSRLTNDFHVESDPSCRPLSRMK